MQYKKIGSKVSPCGLIIILLPVVILILPDNLPFCYADCRSIGASGCPVISLIADVNDRCYTDRGSGWLAIRVLDWDTAPSSTRCEMTATVNLSIVPDGCCVGWYTGCSDGVNSPYCTPYPTLPPSQLICGAALTTTEKTVACDCGNQFYMELGVMTNDSCYNCENRDSTSEGILFIASGRCQNQN